MGTVVSSWMEYLFPKKECDVLMVGLDAAGKTTVLYQLRLGEIINTQPTIGFNVEQVEYKNLSFTVFDVGGQERIRPLWRHYFRNVGAIIFVIDSTDSDRLDRGDSSAKAELDRLLIEPLLMGAPLLIFANKQDMSEALSVDKVGEMLELRKIQDRKWYCQACSAKTGDGLYHGLDWLARTIQ